MHGHLHWNYLKNNFPTDQPQAYYFYTFSLEAILQVFINVTEL